MQRQEVSLEEQQMVMQQMEAARLAYEATKRQHMEALQQLENMAGGLVYGPHPQPPPPELSLEDFLKHQPAKFNDKTSPALVD